jgi:type III secretion protein J
MKQSDIYKIFSFLILVGLFSLFFTGCDSTRAIVNDLQEKEANEIVVFLDRKGIPSQKVAQTAATGGGSGVVLYQVVVSKSVATEAMAILNMHGLPRKKSDNLLTLFSQGGLVPSELEEKIRYQAGLAEQIASTIRKIDGVLDADIQLSFPEENPLQPEKDRKEKTASVYVKHTGVLDDPNSHLRTKIRRLVSSSIDGLKYENVTVITDRARFIGDTDNSQGFQDTEREWVRIWGIVLAKESQTTFQVIFFSFSIIVLVFMLGLLFVIYKTFPILQAGGFGQMLSIKPIQLHEAIKDNKSDGAKSESEALVGEAKPAQANEDEDEEDDEEEDEEEDDEEEEEKKPPPRKK